MNNRKIHQLEGSHLNLQVRWSEEKYQYSGYQKKWDSFTVWKFQDFSVIQILLEIDFGESGSSKNAVFAIFWGSEFWIFGKFQTS